MEVDIKIQGVDVIKDVLAHLPPAMRKKALRPSMKSAMKIVQKAASNNIKSVTSGDSTGKLERSLRVYSLKTKRGVLRTAVMVQRGLVYPNRFYRGAPLRVGMIGGILEYGTDKQPPRSWIRKAARESVGAVYIALEEQIRKRLDKALAASKSRQL